MDKIFKKTFILIVFILVLQGCSLKDNTTEYPVLPYPPVIVWNNKAYVVTDDTIAAERIGKEIGTVIRYIDPDKSLPEKDGDSTIAPKGSPFYEVEGQDEASVIAVLFEGEYRKAFR
ncbi:hypothetical protein MKZ24_25660 [Paenibacillus sp. FSL R7-0297]|uniref:hypothetical protein n=1 Tax=Paenibacillus sp. FSL R7-0297 TaxID=2921680 RepID=UPI0030FC6823